MNPAMLSLRSTHFTVLLLVLLAWTPNVQCQTISSNWLSATDGDWEDQANWSTPVYPDNNSPNPGDLYDVVMDATGAAYTVDLFGPSTLAVNSITLDSPDVIFDHGFSNLTVDAINLTQGTYEFGQGSIIGATISGSGNLRLTSNGLLQNITLANDSVSVTGNPSIGGDLPLSGTDVQLTGSMSFSDSTPQAIRGNGNLQFTSGNFGRLFISGELTVNSGITIESLTGASGDIRNGELINNGTLRSATGSTLNVIGEEFTNNSVIDVGGTFRIGRDSSSNWTNNGTITLRSDSRLSLTGTFTQADLGTIVDEGAQEVVVFGVWDNTGQILDLNNLGFDAPLRFGGTFRGGRIVGEAGTDIAGILDGVTIGSDFDIAEESFTAGVIIPNGLTLNDATLTVFESGELAFRGGETQFLDGTGTILTVNRPQTGARVTISGSELTIGENITIRNRLENRDCLLNFLENRGQIIDEAIDGDLRINASASTTWTNSGTIQALGRTVEIGGERLLNTGRLLAGEGATLQFDMDLLTNEGQLELAGGDVEINADSLFQNGTNGTISGNGNIFLLIETLRNNGTISPDGGLENPTGLLTIDGDVVLFGDGVFELEIGGDESCDYDAIDVTGRLVLGGTLNVSFMEDFTLGRCHEFVFARGEDVVGEFTEYPEGTLVGQVGTRDFFITYTAGDGNDAAIFSPVLLGDVNLDQVVNFLDISPFISLLSTGEFLPEADVNQSGEVNFLDISGFIGILSSPGT